MEREDLTAMRHDARVTEPVVQPDQGHAMFAAGSRVVARRYTGADHIADRL